MFFYTELLPVSLFTHQCVRIVISLVIWLFCQTFLLFPLAATGLAMRWLMFFWAQRLPDILPSIPAIFLSKGLPCNYRYGIHKSTLSVFQVWYQGSKGLQVGFQIYSVPVLHSGLSFSFLNVWIKDRDTKNGVRRKKLISDKRGCNAHSERAMKGSKLSKSTKQDSVESSWFSWTRPLPSSAPDPTQSRANLNIEWTAKAGQVILGGTGICLCTSTPTPSSGQLAYKLLHKPLMCTVIFLQ